jgi:basic membrane protein A
MSKAFRAVMVAALVVSMGLLSSSLLPVMGQPNKLCIVYDVGGRGDLSFNDMAALGGSQAAADFGWELIEQQSATEADYLPNLRTLAESGECVAVIGIGFLLGDAMNTAAQEFPEQSFAIIDSVVDQPNVQSVVYQEHVGSALIGALGALVNQRVAPEGSAGGVGVVLGIEIPVLWKFECGYKAGIRWVDNGFDNSVFDISSPVASTSTPVPFVYTGSFNDPALGQSAGEAQLAQGAQIIFNVAGLTGRGAITAVANAGRALSRETGPPYAFGVDANQDYLEGGGFVLASMMKRVDTGVYTVGAAIADGTFAGGVSVLGLPEGGISISTLDDFDTFLQLGIDAGEIDADDRTLLFGRAKANRDLFVNEFAKMAELQALIADGTVSVVEAVDQDTIDQCRAAYD